MNYGRKQFAVLVLLAIGAGSAAVIAGPASAAQTLTVGVGQQFATVQAAVNAAGAGDTVVITPGRYFERNITIKKGGTPDQPLTIKGQPGAVLDHGIRVTEARYIGEGGFRLALDYAGAAVTDGTFTAAQLAKNDMMVVIKGRQLTRVYNTPLVQPGQFRIDADGSIFLRPFGSNDPTPDNTVVLNANDGRFEYSGIRVSPLASNVVMDGIAQQGAGAAISLGFWNSLPVGNSVVIKNCKIEHSWQFAIRMNEWAGVVVDNCDIRNAGLANWPRGRYKVDASGNRTGGRVGWPHAVISWNADNVLVQNSRITDNHGEGVGPFLRSAGWTMRNNVVADNWSVNLYVDSEDGGHVVDRNIVYNTPGKYESADELIDGAALGVNGKADGIRIANENSDLNGQPDNVVENVRVTNNLVIGTNGGISSFAYFPKQVMILKDSLIANNTLVDIKKGSKQGALTVDRAINVRVLNNIVLGGPMFVGNGQVGSAIGVQASNNIVPAGVRTEGERIQVDGTVTAPPAFTGGTGVAPDGYELAAGSTGIDAGVTVPDLTQDLLGANRVVGARIDIGALETSSSPTPTLAPTTLAPSTLAPTTVAPTTVAVPTTTPSPAQGVSGAWSSADVGKVSLAGSTRFLSEPILGGGSIQIQAGGRDIWNQLDEFHFASKSLTGDGTVTARVANFAAPDVWSKAGVMIRANRNPDSPHVFVALTGQAGTAFQRRLTVSANSLHTAGQPGATPRWVRLERKGATVTGSESTDGINWVVVGSVQIDLGDNPLIGLAVTSHRDRESATATFDSVKFSPEF
jgi:regulation of enolase protein 1 (concanavalin A-like superfamily)